MTALSQLPVPLLLDCADRFGTPLYVYDLDLIRERLDDLRAVVTHRPLRILYAMKANYNPAILRMLAGAGAWIDAVSPAEVQLALRSGFTADRMLYTANNITDAEMREVAQAGVLFNIGSLSRLKKYCAAFPGTRVCLRFNPDVVAGAHEKIRTGGNLTKFGILLEDAGEASRICRDHGVQVVGLHKHTGSGINDIAPFLQAAENMLGVGTPELFPHLEFVDFGGGFAVPYHPEERRIDYTQFGKAITGVVEQWAGRFGREVALYFEPGKYLVAEAGVFLVEVNTLKDNRGRLIAGTNSGFPQLIRPMFYDAYHHIENLTNPAGAPRRYDVCGNICETGDRFATDRELPEIREGDILAIRNAGAYCYSMGGFYNLRAMPSEAVIEEGSARLVRPRLTNEQLVESILSECEDA